MSIKIVDAEKDDILVRRIEASEYFDKSVNNTSKDSIYIVKKDDKIISFSGEYYKFAWKKLSYLKQALSLKFGKDMSRAMVDSGVIEIYKVEI